MNGLSDAVWQQLAQLYPVLQRVPQADLARILPAHATQARVPAGAVLFQEGAPCHGFPMVLEGAVRVARGAAQGRSLELYRVTPGELCVVSTSCLFGQVPLQAHGTASEPTGLVVLSPDGFARLVEHEAFRTFVFGAFADRLADLMSLAEAVAFHKLDQRLAQALLGRGTVVTATHQALADELGTVREIVTRLLRRFERAGWVRLGRERIEVLDAARLRSAAAGGLPI